MEKHKIWGRTDYHCEYCGCPIDKWTPMDTYKSDRCCELYSDFFNIIWDLEAIEKPYRYIDVLKECLKFKDEYPDVPDFQESVNEMVDIGVDTGIMTKLYVGGTKLKIIE